MFPLSIPLLQLRNLLLQRPITRLARTCSTHTLHERHGRRRSSFRDESPINDWELFAALNGSGAGEELRRVDGIVGFYFRWGKVGCEAESRSESSLDERLQLVENDEFKLELETVDERMDRAFQREPIDIVNGGQHGVQRHDEDLHGDEQPHDFACVHWVAGVEEARGVVDVEA